MNQTRVPMQRIFRVVGGTLVALAVYGAAVALLNNVAPQITHVGIGIGIVWPDHADMTRELWDFGGWLLVLLACGALAATLLVRLCRPQMLWCAAAMGVVLLVFAVLQRSDLHRALTGGAAANAWNAMMRRDLHSPVVDFESFVVFPFAPWFCGYVFRAFARRRARHLSR